MDISANAPLSHLSPVRRMDPATESSHPAPAARTSSSQVSASAKQLSQLAKLAREAPDVRQDKVDQIKSQIDSGQYKVNLEKLADHLSKVLE